MPTLYDISNEEAQLNWYNTLESHQILALFPVRLETRFLGGGAVSIRVYPDDIHVATHRRSWTEAERLVGLDFRSHWDEATTDEARETAWNVLVRELGPERAAWMARQDPATLSSTQNLDTSAWTAPARALGLPSRWVALGYVQGVRVAVSLGQPIPATLPVGFDPDVNTSALELPLWMTDLTEAYAQGMALTLNLTQDAPGFDRIVVVGVRDGETSTQNVDTLGELLESHRYTRGLDYLDPLTPTNNLDGATRSAYQRRGGKALFSQGATGDTPATITEGMDVSPLATGLGLDPQDLAHEVLSRPQKATGTWRKDEEAMHQALWSMSWDYYLSEFMAPLVPWRERKIFGHHFIHHVKALGPYPMLQVGAQPYGILPVGDLDAWRPRAGEYGESMRVDTLLANEAQTFSKIPLWDGEGAGVLYRALRDVWKTASSTLPHITPGTSQPQTELVKALVMGSTSCHQRRRVVLGEQVYQSLASSPLLNWDAQAMNAFTLNAEQTVDTLLESLGLHDYTTTPRQEPPHLSRTYPLCTSREEPSAMLTTSAPQFQSGAAALEGLLALTDAELVDDAFMTSHWGARSSWPLFFTLMHRSIVRALEVTTWTILHQRDALGQPFIPREPEISGITGQPSPPTLTELWAISAPDLGFMTNSIQTLGEVFALLRTGVSGEDAESNWTSSGLHTESARWEFEEYFALWESIKTLSTLPDDRLEVLVSTTMDTCSHRLDAWITSLWSTRLAHLRETERASGLYLGGFGWLEHVYPETAPVELDGFLMAPTVAQAQAAAILRSGQRDKLGTGALQEALMRLDLHSEAVRDALGVLEDIRQGVSAGSVCGYYLERWLRDNFKQSGQTLTSELTTLRQTYPLHLTQLNTASEATPALYMTLDGLQWLRAWQQDPTSLNVVTGATHRPLYEAALERLARAMRTIHDLSLAEAVYQYSRGNMARASAALDTLAAEALPLMEYEFLRTLRPALPVTHHVGCLMQTSTPVEEQTGAWGSTTQSLRRRLAPRLDTWLAEQWGDAHAIVAGATLTTRQGKSLTTKVSLGMLGLSPLEVLAMLPDSGEAQDGLVESFMRVKLGEMLLTYGVEVDFDEPITLDWSTSMIQPGECSMANFVGVLSCWRQALSQARPLDARDVSAPGKAASTSPGYLIQDVLTTYQTLHGELSQMAAELRADITVTDPVVLGVLNSSKVLWGDETAPDVQAGETLLVLPPQTDWDRLVAAIFEATPTVFDDTLRARLRTHLERAARLGIEGATPTIPHQDPAREASIALARVVRMLPALETRLEQGSITEPTPDAEIILDAARRLLGSDVLVGFPFVPVNPLMLTESLNQSASLQGVREPAQAWSLRMSRVHETLDAWMQSLALTGHLVGRSSALAHSTWMVGQMPYQSGDVWVGTHAPVREEPVVSLVMCAQEGLDLSSIPPHYAGWLLESWTESIPLDDQGAGVTFHHPQPSSRPPQTMLLGVPTSADGSWSLEGLERIVLQALELGALRAVDLDELGSLSHVLPALYLPFTTDTQDVAVDLEPN